MEEAPSLNDIELRCSRGKDIINTSRVERNPLKYIQKSPKQNKKNGWTQGRKQSLKIEVHNLDQFENPKFHNLVIQIFANRICYKIKGDDWLLCF